MLYYLVVFDDKAGQSSVVNEFISQDYHCCSSKVYCFISNVIFAFLKFRKETNGKLGFILNLLTILVVCFKQYIINLKLHYSADTFISKLIPVLLVFSNSSLKSRDRRAKLFVINLEHMI